MVFDVHSLTHRRANRLHARLHHFVAASLCALPLAFATPAHAGVLDHVTAFQIQPEGLRQALLAFGRQAHLQIIFRGAEHTEHAVPGLSGRYSARELIAPFLKGTHLTYSVTDRTVEIFPMARGEANRRTESGGGPAVIDKEGPTARRPKTSRRSQNAETPPILQQVIVTGSHISGGPPPSGGGF